MYCFCLSPITQLSTIHILSLQPLSDYSDLFRNPCLLALQPKWIYPVHTSTSMSTWNPRNKLVGDMQYSEGSMWNLPKTFPGTFLRTFPQFAPNLLLCCCFLPEPLRNLPCNLLGNPEPFSAWDPLAFCCFWQRPAKYPMVEGPNSRLEIEWSLATGLLPCWSSSPIPPWKHCHTPNYNRHPRFWGQHIPSFIKRFLDSQYTSILTWYSPSTIGTIDRQMPWPNNCC